VTRDRRDGHDVFYGDASDTKFLEACGLATAAGVIITIHTHDLIDVVVEHVRALRPDILIVSRARDADHARHLYALAPPMPCLRPSRQACSFPRPPWWIGRCAGPVIASIHEKRDEIRHALQEAAKKAGRGTIRSVRAKTRKTLRR